jgi:hypothetical protein
VRVSKGGNEHHVCCHPSRRDLRPLLRVRGRDFLAQAFDLDFKCSFDPCRQRRLWLADAKM